MTESRRELVLIALLILAVALGSTLDVLGDPVATPKDEAPAGDFTARAVFCPTPVVIDDGGAQLAVTASSEEALVVGIEPTAPEAVELAAGRALLTGVEPGPPPMVTGFGGTVMATALEVAAVPVRKGSTVTGVGAGNCAEESSEKWYFAQGSSLLDFDERLLVANPFSDEAVVRVRIFTPTGEKIASGLTQVAVPAGEVRVVEINNYVKTEAVLSTSVEAIRGRVIAWKELAAKPEEGPPGVTFTLGAPAPSRTWFFPEGQVGSNADEVISVLNPGGEEATVTISLVTEGGLLQPPTLVDLRVAPESSRSIDIEDSLRQRQAELGDISAVLQSTNGIPVVAERTMAYGGEDPTGLSSEAGSTRGALEWLVGPAAFSPSFDALVVMNTGPGDVRLDVSLRGEEQSLAPRELRDIKVAAGLRTKIRLDELTHGEPMVARVVATGPVVVERLSYSSSRDDVGSVMGQPVQ